MNKTMFIRLSWWDLIIPFGLIIAHTSEAKIGIADHFSRHPVEDKTIEVAKLTSIKKKLEYSFQILQRKYWH